MFKVATTVGSQKRVYGSVRPRRGRGRQRCGPSDCTDGRGNNINTNTNHDIHKTDAIQQSYQGRNSCPGGRLSYRGYCCTLVLVLVTTTASRVGERSCAHNMASKTQRFAGRSRAGGGSQNRSLLKNPVRCPLLSSLSTPLHASTKHYHGKRTDLRYCVSVVHHRGGLPPCTELGAENSA